MFAFALLHLRSDGQDLNTAYLIHAKTCEKSMIDPVDLLVCWLLFLFHYTLSLIIGHVAPGMWIIQYPSIDPSPLYSLYSLYNAVAAAV